jgi:hypothetical protein
MATRSLLLHSALEVILGHLDILLVGPVQRVDILVCNNVAVLLHRTLAICVARGVWRAHVCWVLVENVADSHFSLDHLVRDCTGSDCAQVWMAPSMTGDLMPFGVHSVDNVNPPGVCIDSAMAVVSAHEECCLEAILCQSVEELASVDVGSVVKRQSDSTRLRTRANASTTIRNVALLRTRIVDSARTGLARL